MIHSLVRRGALTLAVLAALVAALIATEVLSDRVALWVSDTVFPVVAIGAGLFLCLGAFHRHGRSRTAWSLFGLGVILLGVGELSWAWYELLLSQEPPFPGLPDVFYLAAYPVLTAAVLVTPRLAANRYQRGQQIIDGVVIVVAVAMLAWVIVLEPMYLSAGEVTLPELLVGAAYPVADALLIAIVGVVGLRRTFHIRDRALWSVIAALVFTAAADVIYLSQSWSGTYESGAWLDSLWLVGYGLFALAAFWLPDPVEQRERREGRLPIWYVLLPVAAIVAIIGWHLASEMEGGEGIAFEVLASMLGILILGRVLFTVSEDRYLVEEERKRLISVVSHELRTPLTAVEGYLELALANWDSGDRADNREMVEIAQDQAHLVTRIVTDLVAASRDNLHATELDLETVDLARLVEEVAARFGFGDRFHLRSETSIQVLADRGRLSQIVTNLVANADRYGGGGDVVCVLRQVGAQVEVSVHDSGPGVSSRHQENIWNAFDRGPHRFDAATPGSGLGLAIVRSLAEAHGGAVGYRPSDLLGGACFWVRLPRGDEQKAPAADGMITDAPVLPSAG